MLTVSVENGDNYASPNRELSDSMQYKIVSTFITLFFSSFLFASDDVSKHIASVEPLLMSGKYDEADEKFYSAGRRVLHHAYGGNIVKNIYSGAVTWLRNADKQDSILSDVEQHPQNYSARYNYNIEEKSNCSNACRSYSKYTFTSSMQHPLDEST